MNLVGSVLPVLRWESAPSYRIRIAMGRQINVISDQLAAELDMPQRTCRRLIQRLLEEIQDDIVNTGRIEFRGLGTFSVTEKPGHSTEHPGTGQPVYIPAKKLVEYRSAKALRERLNP